MKTITLTEEEFVLLRQALTIAHYKEAECAITFNMPSFKGYHDLLNKLDKENK